MQLMVDGVRVINLAMNKPALQSSTSEWSSSHLPEEDARGANNGNISGDMGFHTDREQNPWWQVDLEDEFLIRRVVIYNRHREAQRLRHFSILRSLDGHRWVTFYRKIDSAVFGDTDSRPYVAEVHGDQPARFVRVQLEGCEWLHFNECQVFGVPLDPETRDRIAEDEARTEREQQAIPDGGEGHVSNIDGFHVFVDTRNYAAPIVTSLDNGSYERRERQLTAELVRPSDRIIEAGTAIGIVSMTAALIVGAENVLTFDANPDIIEHARQNFRRNRFSQIISRIGVLKNRRKIAGVGETVNFYVDKAFWASRLDASPTTPGIVKAIQIPVYCLEDEISAHAANVLICDIEGGEIELLTEADLSGIRLIILETHCRESREAETDAMMRKLIMEGFSLHLGYSGDYIVVLRR